MENREQKIKNEEQMFKHLVKFQPLYFKGSERAISLITDLVGIFL